MAKRLAKVIRSRFHQAGFVEPAASFAPEASVVTDMPSPVAPLAGQIEDVRGPRSPDGRGGLVEPLESSRLPCVRLPRYPTKVSRLRRDRSGTRSTECAGQLGEDRQVGMEPDPLDPAHAEREQRPLVLQASELPLD